VFTLAAVPLAAIPEWLKTQWRDRRARWIGPLAALGLFVIAASLNYRLTFDEFAKHIRLTHLNTSEAGHVITGFAETIGSYDTAHVIPYPYWMDTTLVGIQAGQGIRNFAFWPDQLEELTSETRPQLFILNKDDADSLLRLQELFPEGSLKRWESESDSRDFLMYSVPAAPSQEP
jgi:hypothetical protein